jgi:hypothetical protein
MGYLSLICSVVPKSSWKDSELPPYWNITHEVKGSNDAVAMKTREIIYNWVVNILKMALKGIVKQRRYFCSNMYYCNHCLGVRMKTAIDIHHQVTKCNVEGSPCM